MKFTSESGSQHRGWHRRTKLVRLVAAIGLAVAGVAGASVLAAAPASASTSGVLYAPNTTTNPNEDASYPRVIRLAHSGSSNGTLLATFSHSGVGTTRQTFRSIDQPMVE